MRLLVYTPNKFPGAPQSAVSDNCRDVWSKLDLFFNTHVDNFGSGGVSIGSSFAHGQNSVVDDLFRDLISHLDVSDKNAKRVIFLPRSQMHEAVKIYLTYESSLRKIVSSKSNHTILKMKYLFEWKINDFSYPEWLKDDFRKSAIELELGQTITVSPYLVFPYDTGTDSQSRILATSVEGLPWEFLLNHFKVYKKAVFSISHKDSGMKSMEEAFVLRHLSKK